MKVNPVTRPTSLVGAKGIKSLIAFVLLSLVGVATWQLGQVSPSAPYRAPLLSLHLSDAVAGNFDFSADDLAVREVSLTGFAFETNEDAVLALGLEFSGAPKATQKAMYDLSADYPLTLTLLEDGEASATFTATQGTAEFHEGSGRVAAFMMDESGRTLFLGAHFAYSDNACSETYWFCFNSGEGGTARVN